MIIDHITGSVGETRDVLAVIHLTFLSDKFPADLAPYLSATPFDPAEWLRNTLDSLKDETEDVRRSYVIPEILRRRWYTACFTVEFKNGKWRILAELRATK